jgi:glucose-6-phosphate isomerase
LTLDRSDKVLRRCHPRGVATSLDPRTTEAWATLTDLAASRDHADLDSLFAADSSRAERFTVRSCDLRVDFSKQLISDDVASALLDLAGQTGIIERFNDMRAGVAINNSERRQVLHTALRRSASDELVVDGVDVVADVHAVLAKMRTFASSVRSGEWTGSIGHKITTVVNIGIGGSDLGPAMATIALAQYADPDIDIKFVSNVDPADVLAALAEADAQSTLFIVASKTFTTIETMTNAATAKDWLLEQLGPEVDVARHFVALSTNSEAVAAFGIDGQNMFEFWDWVGGRYSVDSAIGLSVMIAIGPDHFDEMLAGFLAIDEHVAHAPLAQNGPVLAALVGVWNRNFLGYDTLAVLPYAEQLRRFPAYLQQLDMESNGKSVHRDGQRVAIDTAPIVWGEPGTNGQHAFYQLLHQGTTVVPVDLIGFLEPAVDANGQHDLLFGNLVAQAEALAFGRSSADVSATESDAGLVPHRTFEGNRPSTAMIADRLTPNVLGQLIGFYEHKVFAQGTIWGVNSFDQWGVELGKQLATAIGAELSAESFDPSAHDGSTSALIELYRSHHR